MYIIQNDGPGGKASALARQTKLEMALWFRFCPCTHTKVKDAQTEQQYVWAANSMSGQQYLWAANSTSERPTVCQSTSL